MTQVSLAPEVPLREVTFVAFDLETTGLSPVIDEIVEFGAVRFRLDGDEQDVCEQLVDPQCMISARVTRIHGITNAMVCGKPTLAEALPGFLDFVSGDKTILLAHNAEFDLGFLNFGAARLGLALPAIPALDTLALARVCVRGLRSFRLVDLARHLGLAELEQHRALPDSRLVMRLFRHVIGAAGASETVGDLFRLVAPLCLADVLTPKSPLPADHKLLALAIAERRTVVITYESLGRRPADRRITPHQILETGDCQYLIAYCHAAQIGKIYRVDRIHAIRPAADDDGS